MLRLACVLSATAILTLAPFSARAQDAPADITVVSVLTMAKETAEGARRHYAGRLLRDRVVVAIERTGLTKAFETYVADAQAARDPLPTGLPPDIVREIERNREIEAEAKRILLAGDEERAAQVFRQCRFVPHWSLCLTKGDFLQAQFLRWEVAGGKLSAALHRLTTNPWANAGWRGVLAVPLAQALIGTGRHAEGLDVLRLVQTPGGTFDPCVVDVGSSNDGAAFRRLACEGNAAAALVQALAVKDAAKRTVALAIVAEGLAKIPGYSDERLEPL